MTGFGVDIGGSGVKGAPVALELGHVTQDRFRIETPQPSTPEAVGAAVVDVVRHFGWTGTVGVTFPGVITGGVVRTAANMDHRWIDLHGDDLLSGLVGAPVKLLNDADAAGMAEMKFGAGQGHKGLVLMITLGTGIGSAAFFGGELIPNTELGHIEIDGHDAEDRAAARVREDEDLKWSQYAKRLQRYFSALETVLWPELFIVGGGISAKADKFLPLLKLRTPIVPAALANEAGIVGAALAAQ
ncbi:MAG: polyphosphate glucokinase [Acidimicrobiia bacterium]|nr:polyphosphate glucokinase [Acidimicrobiia bacterium]